MRRSGSLIKVRYIAGRADVNVGAFLIGNFYEIFLDIGGSQPLIEMLPGVPLKKSVSTSNYGNGNNLNNIVERLVLFPMFDKRNRRRVSCCCHQQPTHRRP